MAIVLVPKFIKPIKKPKQVSCNNCKYFDKETKSCKLFFSQNYYGEIVYHDAEKVRKDQKLCGSNGVYFKLF